MFGRVKYVVITQSCATVWSKTMYWLRFCIAPSPASWSPGGSAQAEEKVEANRHDGALRQMICFEFWLRDVVGSSIVNTIFAKYVPNNKSWNPRLSTQIG